VLLETSSDNVALVLLVHAIGILELQHPFAGDGLDVGRKSRDLDNSPAAHSLESLILKVQSSFPEHTVRSNERVLILEWLRVSGGDLSRTTDLLYLVISW
jgi:hypothetical protein